MQRVTQLDRQTPRRSEPVMMSELVFPEHTNPYGTMFGGHAFAVMDKAAFLAANSFAPSLFVTASSESVDFNVPVRSGMILETVAQVIHSGRTSVVVRVILNAREPLSTEKHQATVGYFTMVAIDADGKPVEVPELIVEDRAEWEHAEQIRAVAAARRKRRSGG
jgi:uncharacterized protein (TIGR00369 family)